jgi:hypothetical protein
MKKLALFALLSLSFILSSAQKLDAIDSKIIVDNFDLESLPKGYFIQVSIMLKPMSVGKYITVVDYGQPSEANPPVIKNSSGEIILFKSVMDCANFFNARGWKLSFHEVALVGNSHFHYLTFKRE